MAAASGDSDAIDERNQAALAAGGELAIEALAGEVGPDVPRRRSRLRVAVRVEVGRIRAVGRARCTARPRGMSSADGQVGRIDIVVRWEGVSAGAHLGLLTPVAMLGLTVVGTAPPTSITGDVASVGALSGFTDLAAQISGTVYSLATPIVPAGMLAAFDVVRADLNGRATAPALPFSAVVAGAGPLPPGLYVSAPAVTLATNMVLDAGNDRDATFIFRVTGAFTLAADVHVTLQGGADPANVFFVSDGAVVLGAAASVSGTIVTPAAVTLGAAAEINGGRLLTKDAALTLGAATTVSVP